MIYRRIGLLLLLLLQILFAKYSTHQLHLWCKLYFVKTKWATLISMCVQFFDSDFIFGIWNLHFEFEYLPYYSTNVCKFRACCKLFTYLTIFPILYNIHIRRSFRNWKTFFYYIKYADCSICTKNLRTVFHIVDQS